MKVIITETAIESLEQSLNFLSSKLSKDKLETLALNLIKVSGICNANLFFTLITDAAFTT